MRNNYKIIHRNKKIILLEGFLHPVYIFLKYCPECKKFKNKKKKFSSYKIKSINKIRYLSSCKSCRAKKTKEKYKSNSKMREYYQKYSINYWKKNNKKIKAMRNLKKLKSEWEKANSFYIFFSTLKNKNGMKFFEEIRSNIESEMKEIRNSLYSLEINNN